MLVFLQHVLLYQFSGTIVSYDLKIWKYFEFLSEFFLVYLPLQCKHFFATLSLSLAANINYIQCVFMLVPVAVDTCFFSCEGDVCF